ncbi:adhesion G protein-coupled receptor E1-like [Penaeus indicus]|uniref:adhesion G protein-coupled receptor E1-like n=1 Tax=Penaeus indicus TaxID=29960 RepID=UPI00300D4146
MALSNLFLIVLLGLSSCMRVKASCARPDCNENVPSDNPLSYQLADPENCHKFYYCFDDNSDNIYNITDTSYWCEDHGAVFSQGDQLCGNYTCVESCSGTCAAYECSSDPSQEKRSDPFDCSIYYTCPDGAAVHCEGDKPFFDGDQCQEDESKCCHCKPYCRPEDLFKNVLDPVDCKSYYFCVKKYDFPTSQATCPSGNFNPFTLKCDDAFPCISACKNVVGCDGCIDIFTCEQYGNWPKCPQRCDPHYYHCGYEDFGHVVQESACSSPSVYNPDTGKCVTEGECAYDPPSQC